MQSPPIGGEVRQKGMRLLHFARNDDGRPPAFSLFVEDHRFIGVVPRQGHGDCRVISPQGARKLFDYLFGGEVYFRVNYTKGFFIERTT